MKNLKIKNQSRGLKEQLNARYCESFACKLVGLSLRRRLANEEALILAESRPSRLYTGIHMLGMFFDVSVIWLDQNFKVVDKVLAKTWRTFAFPRLPAQFVIECAVSHYEEFQVGDQIAFEDQ